MSSFSRRNTLHKSEIVMRGSWQPCCFFHWGSNVHQFSRLRGFYTYLGESCKACNQRTLWVGRWPAGTPWPHLIFHASTVCVQCKCLEKQSLETVISDHSSLRFKVGALGLREVIFFFHSYSKSKSVVRLTFKSRRDGEQVYADGDQCSRNLWDWNDLGWQFQSALLLSLPGLDWGHLSGWHQHSQIPPTVYTLPAASSSLICLPAPLLHFYGRGD